MGATLLHVSLYEQFRLSVSIHLEIHISRYIVYDLSIIIIDENLYFRNSDETGFALNW